MTRKLTAYAAGLMACSAFTAPAFAQDNEEQARQAPRSDNVIIVTATRRASDVQDIPIAVTAVTPAQLEQQGIANIQTLGAVAPSFNIQSSQTESQGTSIRIRGIGTTGNNIGLESAVGVFIDGVYQSRPGVALGELVDVEQVEVLRGPQGTLFGRNTTAGALVVRNRAPDLNEFSGFAQASYGNYDFMNVQGALNTPVSDSLGFRFTGAYRKRDGFLIDATGNDVNDKDRYMVRGQMLWEPSADISLRIIGDYQKSNELCCDSITMQAASQYTPAFFAAAAPNGVAMPYHSTTSGQFNAQSLDSDDLFSNGNGVVNDTRQWGISGELVWNFGDVEFTGIVAYRDFLGESVQDDFQAVQIYSVAGVTEDNLPPTFDDITTFTAEARLQGTAFNDSLDWLIGVYYADEDIVEEASLTLGPDFQAYVGQANFGNALGPLAPALLGLVAQSGAYLNTVFAGAPDPSIFATPISADNAFGYNRYEQQGESFSVFTHNILSVTDTLDLTLGLRYVDDKKDGSYNQLDSNNPACLAGLTLAGTPQATAFAALEPILGTAVAGALSTPALNGPAAFIGCFPFAAPALGVSFLPREFDLTFEDDEFIYTGQLAWEPNPDLLIYGGFTHGYKAGGFNLDSTAAASGGDPRFRSEEIDAYELGLKATLLDGRARANFSFFYNELQDFQVLEFTGTQFQTFNVDDVTAKGFEAELFAQWTPYISNSLAVTYTDANYGDDCDAQFVAAGGPNPALELCGTSLTNAPDIVGVFGMTYDGPLVSSSDWSFLANVNVRYETSRRTSTKGLTSANGVITGLVPFDVQDANMKVNARIGFTSPDESFGIELWGVNLTNEITRGITFNTPLAGDGRSAFIDDPRTYGVTVRTKF
ncbi:MAG: TonB-dependent receptor [Erythrobacteraceae bacterium]|nr:TonB-dependent receptor [Erythrobacteraceae bacterium]